MPELPEVETIKRDLKRLVLSKAIRGVTVSDPRVIARPAVSGFIRALKNRTVLSVRRRAKALVMCLHDGLFLVIQPKMTGQLIYGEMAGDAKVVFALSDGQYLNYHDRRVLGRLSVLRNLEQSTYLSSVGPDPLDRRVNDTDFFERLHSRKRPIKALLMDQTFLGGIGNIYASEILFRAGIHPLKPSSRLSLPEAKRLVRIMREVLKEAIRFRGTSMSTYRDVLNRKGRFLARIRVYGRQGQPCFGCRLPIERTMISGRSTFYCGRCQNEDGGTAAKRRG